MLTHQRLWTHTLYQETVSQTRKLQTYINYHNTHVMATHYGGVGDTSMEDPETQDLDNTSQDDFQDENIVQNLLCKTECLKQAIGDRDNDPREAIQQLEQRLNN